MKTAIRRNTFETNSSSVHSLILIPYDVADEWRKLDGNYWLDMVAVENEASSSGTGYGDIAGVSAPAEARHLIDADELEAEGKWRGPAPYQDEIDVNWALPLDVIDNPDRFVNDSWSSIYNVDETDEGYLVELD